MNNQKKSRKRDRPQTSNIPNGKAAIPTANVIHNPTSKGTTGNSRRKSRSNKREDNSDRINNKHQTDRENGFHRHAENHSHDNTLSRHAYNRGRRQECFSSIQECIHEPSGSGPQKSVEGWVIIVTGVHDEALEEDIRDSFSEYGKIKHIHVNLDRRTGFCKGYALVEYEKKSEAQDAINAVHGKELLGKTLGVAWAFVGSPADSAGFDSTRTKKMKRR